MRTPDDIAELGEKAEPAIPYLVSLLGDTAPVQMPFLRLPISTGEAAAYALAKIGTPAFEPLISVLQSENLDAWPFAAWALGQLSH